MGFLDGKDKQILEDLGGISEEEYEGYLREFIGPVEEKLEKIKNAIKSDDFVEISNLGHGIKGESANWGLNEIKDLANYIKVESEGQKRISILEENINKLISKVEFLKNELGK